MRVKGSFQRRVKGPEWENRYDLRIEASTFQVGERIAPVAGLLRAIGLALMIGLKNRKSTANRLECLRMSPQCSVRAE
jgi:hypothetical protein